MNLLLLHDDDFQPDGSVRLRGRRLTHAREVLRVAEGQAVRVGRFRGRVGTGTVVSQSPSELVLSVALTEAPPPRPGIDLLLAIPRPKALKKLLPAIASIGVDRLVLLNAARVEKSYFDAKVLAPEAVADFLAQGLEQAKDTCPPEVLVRHRFKPFVEDELDVLFPREGCVRVLPHPPATRSLAPVPPSQRLLVAVGPEGGWVPFEVELLERFGFTPVSLGPRTLRTEVAVPMLLGALRAEHLGPAVSV